MRATGSVADERVSGTNGRPCARFHRTRVVVIAVVLCAVLVVTSGAAGARPKKKKPEGPLKHWSSTICVAFSRWQTQVTTIATAGPLGDELRGLPNAATPEEIRLAVPNLLVGVLTATDGLSRDVLAAGVPPKVPEGPAVALQFAASVQELTTIFFVFKQRADQLPPNLPGPLFSETNDLASVLQSAGNTLPNTVQKIATANPTSRIPKAFATAKSCKGLV